MSFNTLGLSQQILRSVQEKGYTTPTDIQARVIPLVLQRKDILGGAQTGTGKTASFLLPLLHLLESQKKGKNPQVLILAPTRELANQIHEQVRMYGKYLQVKSVAVFGGAPIRPQIAQLRKGVQVLIATPGRLIDHLTQKTVDLSSVEFVVLDEADCMLDMGFIPDVRKILSFVPEKRQTLLFSATFSKAIATLAKDFLQNPEVVQIAKTNAIADQINHVVYPVDRARKTELLYHLITSDNWKQALVFTRTRRGANRLCESLKKDDIHSDVIHGDKSQAARLKALANFKKGKTRILVATDVAARGLDIDHLPYVVNYELPTVASDYVHRIGRTGRAGRKGEAISLVCVDERRLMRDIEKLLEKNLVKITVPGYEVDESIKAEPIRKKRGSGGRVENVFERKKQKPNQEKRFHAEPNRIGLNEKRQKKKSKGRLKNDSPGNHYSKGAKRKASGFPPSKGKKFFKKASKF